jgi:hypothetical protein
MLPTLRDASPTAHAIESGWVQVNQGRKSVTVNLAV